MLDSCLALSPYSSLSPESSAESTLACVCKNWLNDQDTEVAARLSCSLHPMSWLRHRRKGPREDPQRVGEARGSRHLEHRSISLTESPVAPFLCREGHLHLSQSQTCRQAKEQNSPYTRLLITDV